MNMRFYLRMNAVLKTFLIFDSQFTKQFYIVKNGEKILILYLKTN